jgi:hypothetical protein
MRRSLNRRFCSVAEPLRADADDNADIQQVADSILSGGEVPESSMLADPNFRRFMRFGLADQSILMMCLLAGFSLDAVIARRIGVKVRKLCER